MGQLEKYGLYVLCLVIFLILGVTIWGNPAVAAPGQRNDPVPMRVGAGDGSLTGGGQPAIGGGSRNGGSLVANSVIGSAANAPGSLNSLLSPTKIPSVAQSVPGSNPASGSRIASNQPISNSVGNGSVGNDSIGNGLGENGSRGARSQPSAGGDPVAKREPKVNPSRAATREYKVQKGDILGIIAQKQLGSVRHVDRIRALNPGLTETLQIGQVLILPGDGATAVASDAPKAELNSGSYRTYTISKGDTFEGIAEKELGSRARFKEIMRLNSNVDPRRLPLGKKIRLPIK